jgi:hypothetical protein
MNHFSAIPWRDQATFNEMMMMTTKCTKPARLIIFIVLTHWSNSPLVDMLHHSDILSRFRFKRVYSIKLRVYLGLTQCNLPSTTLEHVNHYTTDAVRPSRANIV